MNWKCIVFGHIRRSTGRCSRCGKVVPPPRPNDGWRFQKTIDEWWENPR